MSAAVVYALPGKAGGLGDIEVKLHLKWGICNRLHGDISKNRIFTNIILFCSKPGLYLNTNVGLVL